VSVRIHVFERWGMLYSTTATTAANLQSHVRRAHESSDPQTHRKAISDTDSIPELQLGELLFFAP